MAGSTHNVQANQHKANPLKIFARTIGYYSIHPEKMRQLLRAKDAHAVCNYIASEKYKKKLQEMVEKQKRKVFDEFPEGIYNNVPIIMQFALCILTF